MALMEFIGFDEDGNCLGGSFMDYLIPTAMEVPTGRPASRSPRRRTTRSARRASGSRRPSGRRPAVVNAVVDALAPFGVTHMDMPCTPARVWEAMQGRPTPPI
jgi:carbon-monoxide dehydrogenase large subunit